MPKTLLAVDDSATMRKVLEITFSGEDFKVLLADSGASASKVAESPAAIVVDTVLGSEDGYALARELRRKNPRAAIVLLASRYHPYDQARGKDAGADDFADKPFDTQQLIDKVKKAIVARESAPVQAAPPPAPVAAARPAPGPGALSKSTQPSLGGEVRKNATLIFGDSVPLSPGAAPAPTPPPPPVQVAAPAMPAAPVMPAAPPPAAAEPMGVSTFVTGPPAHVVAAVAAAAPAAPAAAAPAAPAPSIATQVNGQLAPKLEALGLSAAQADAVLALSREVVERVVWEVVPQLAETLIKEEIARLTR